jgi:hypothetical protein
MAEVSRLLSASKKYYRDGCRYLSGSKIAIKRKDAIAGGYDARKVCRP